MSKERSLSPSFAVRPRPLTIPHGIGPDADDRQVAAGRF